MSFVNISNVRTADPSNMWAPKASFFSRDPFAIVMDVQADSSLIQAGLLFDAVFQIVNPRQDPHNHAWYTISGLSDVSMPTIDRDWKGVAFQWTNFIIWYQWAQYSDAVSQIRGPDQINGIFYVQGTISVQGSDLFARSGEFTFKVRP